MPSPITDNPLIPQISPSNSTEEPLVFNSSLPSRLWFKLLAPGQLLRLHNYTDILFYLLFLCSPVKALSFSATICSHSHNLNPAIGLAVVTSTDCRRPLSNLLPVWEGRFTPSTFTSLNIPHASQNSYIPLTNILYSIFCKYNPIMYSC